MRSGWEEVCVRVCVKATCFVSKINTEESENRPELQVNVGESDICCYKIDHIHGLILTFGAKM